MMMRITFLIVAALVAGIVQVDAQVLKQAKTFENEQIIQVSDSIYYQLDSTYTYTATDNSWAVESRISYKYDSNGNILNSITQSNSYGIWTNRSKVDYTYSEDYMDWSAIHTTWNSTEQSWQNIWKKTYSQIEENRQMDILYSEWSQNNSWTNIWQQAQYYNQAGQLLSYQTIKWNSESNKWESYWDYNCYYDNEGNLLQTTHKAFNKEEQIWNDKWECIQDYQSGQLISEQIIDYDHKTDEWNNLKNTSISYTDNKIIKTKDNWNDDQNAWKQNMRLTETQDAAGRTTEIQRDYWNENNSTWQSQRLDLVLYNDQNIKTSEETLYWDNASSSWSNYFKKVYFYSEISIPKEEEIIPQAKELVLYPNPAKTDIYLKFNGEAKQLRIYKMNGTLVMQIESPINGQPINVSTLKKGVYLTVISFEDGEAHSKFIKK